MDVGLAELTSVGVDWEAATQFDVPIAQEVRGLPSAAEPELLELWENQRREVVVDVGYLYVVRTKSGGFPELSRTEPHLGDGGDVVPVVAAHGLLVVGRSLGGGGDHRRGGRQVPGPLHRGDQKGLATVRFLTAVEKAQRFDDPPAFLVVGEGDRLFVEEGGRVVGSMAPVGHRDSAEVLGGGSVLVHVPGREHGDPTGRGQQPERRRPTEGDVEGLGTTMSSLDPAAEPVPGTLVEGPVAEDVVG